MTFSRRARRWQPLLLVSLGLSAGTASRAKHSFAMYDNEHQVKLKGKVTDFQWTNPHVYIELDGVDQYGENKEVKSWVIECANPGILDRIGWKFNMIHKGDEITAIVAPLRSGEPGAVLKQVTLADGK